MSAGLAVEGVLVREALQLGIAVDVTLDEVHPVGVVHGHVTNGDAAVNALGADGALAGGDAVAAQLDDLTSGAHDRGPVSGRCAQRALDP